MSQPPVRKPYDHALYLINHTNEVINAVTTLPGGQAARDLDSHVTAGTLTAMSNLAIASAIVALADAVRGDQ